MHMKAFVSACLRMLDIVLDRYNRQIILFTDHLCQSIDIRCKRTDNTDSRNVINIIDHILNRHFVTVTFQFLNNTLRCLDTFLDVLNRIIFVDVHKFIV